MACFIVPAVEAVVVTVAAKVAEKKSASAETETESGEEVVKIPFARKLKWLRNLLWGGVILLAFEHLWHGEIVPWFPFLTAANNPADMQEVLHEMMTVGVSMAVLVTAVWAVMLGVVASYEKRAKKMAA